MPDQVSVAGFDVIEYSSIFDPALTTMRQPKAEIGRLAALELLRQLSGAEVTEQPSQIDVAPSGAKFPGGGRSYKDFAPNGAGLRSRSLFRENATRRAWSQE